MRPFGNEVALVACESEEPYRQPGSHYRHSAHDKKGDHIDRSANIYGYRNYWRHKRYKRHWYKHPAEIATERNIYQLAHDEYARQLGKQSHDNIDYVHTLRTASAPQYDIRHRHYAKQDAATDRLVKFYSARRLVCHGIRVGQCLDEHHDKYEPQKPQRVFRYPSQPCLKHHSALYAQRQCDEEQQEEAEF